MSKLKITKQNLIYKSILTSLFCLYIFLDFYKTPIFSFGHLIMIVGAIYLVITRKKNSSMLMLIFLYAWILIQSIVLILLNLDYVDNGELIKNTIYFLTFIMIVITFPPNIDFVLMKKILFFISYICLGALFVQAFTLYILELPITSWTLFKSLTDRVFDAYTGSRPSSFFYEPQHYASFMIPIIILKLMDKKILYPIIISFSVVLSTSTQGILIVFVIWILYLLYSRNYKIIFAGTLVVALSIYLFISLDVFSYALDKLRATDFMNNIRVPKPWFIYYEMPLSDKIIGIGINNVNNYIYSTGVAQRWYLSAAHQSPNFLSSLGGNFVHFGFFGGFLFILFLFNIQKKLINEQKILIIIIFLSALSQTIIFNSWFVYYVVISVAIIENNKTVTQGVFYEKNKKNIAKFCL